MELDSGPFIFLMLGVGFWELLRELPEKHGLRISELGVGYRCVIPCWALGLSV